MLKEVVHIQHCFSLDTVSRENGINVTQRLCDGGCIYDERRSSPSSPPPLPPIFFRFHNHNTTFFALLIRMDRRTCSVWVLMVQHSISTTMKRRQRPMDVCGNHHTTPAEQKLHVSIHMYIGTVPSTMARGRWPGRVVFTLWCKRWPPTSNVSTHTHSR